MNLNSVKLYLKNSTKKQQNIRWRHDYDVFMTILLFLALIEIWHKG